MDRPQIPFEQEQELPYDFDQFLRDADAQVRRFFNFIRSLGFCAIVCLLICLYFRFPKAFWLGRRVMDLMFTPLVVVGMCYGILAIIHVKSKRKSAEIIGARFDEEMVLPFQFPLRRELVNEEAQPLFEQPTQPGFERPRQPLFEEEEVVYEDKEIVFEECSSFSARENPEEDSDNKEEAAEPQPAKNREERNDYIMQNARRANELSNEEFNETVFAYIEMCWKVIRKPAPDDDEEDEIEFIHYSEVAYLYGRA